MKFFVLSILSIWLAFGPFVYAKAEEASPYYIALGDSITAGYHRDGAAETMYDFPFSFSGRIAKAKDWEVLNLGITNLTSTEFLEQLEQNPGWTNLIHQAKWVTLDIGANDFIRNPTFFPYIFEGKKLETSDLDILNIEKKKVLDQYEKNLRIAVDWIGQQGPAKLIVLNHYYLPLPGVAGEFINSAIIESNKQLVALAKEKHFQVADLATAFSLSMTLSFLTQDTRDFPINIADMDPHPSAYGQKLIASEVMDIMDESSKNKLIPSTLVSVLWLFFLNLFHS